MRSNRLRGALLLLAFTLCQPLASFGQAAQRDDVQISVRVSDGMIFMDASMNVAATPREVWDVITDFDNAQKFIPNVASSFIVARTDTSMMVSQKINIALGPFTKLVKEVRHLDLNPYESIQARHLSGDMDSSNGSIRLVAEGDVTRVIYKNVTVPKFWVPPFLLDGVLTDEVRNRFTSFKREILRRKQGAAPRQG
jgi:carbon monoxide dehydrogenase subunit G